ncbi:MAG: methyltransferase [Defluviitaleaceae bacterium]|nr:methyltransferase [Defluviitaleaceae bacterium]
MSGLSFIKQYITKPRTVGAIWPSSKYLAAGMVKDIDFNNARCIVEYGPGTGVFTEKILEARHSDTLVILLEYNIEFCKLLQEKYKHEKNLVIARDSAENIEKYLLQHSIQEVDYIISGLPFASLPQEVSGRILQQTQQYLKTNGRFITFQYTKLKVGLIGEYFSRIDMKRVLRNVPPAYVLSCQE